jgi:AAA domain
MLNPENLFGDSEPHIEVEMNSTKKETAGNHSRGQNMEHESDNKGGVKAYTAFAKASGKFKTSGKATPRVFEVVTVSSLMRFDRDKDANNRVGKRWLCKGDSLLIFGDTGIGKSSLVMMAMIQWALGNSLFGLRPVAPLRCLLIQAENNNGDLAIAFQDAVKGLKLNQGDINRLEQMLVFKQECTAVGRDFATYARQQIEEHRPDVIIVDPLLSYCGCDVSQQRDMSPFLRNQIQPILNDTGVIWVFIHHTGKPSKLGNDRDPIFNFLGSVEILNWARESIAIVPHNWENREFKLIFRKRARQADLVDNKGNQVYQLFIKHSKDGVVWESCDGSAQQSSGNSVQEFQAQQNLLRDYIVEHEKVYESEIEVFAKQKSIPLKTANTIADALSKQDGANPRIRRDRDKGGAYYTTVEPGQSEPAPSAKETRKQLKARLTREYILARGFVSGNELRDWGMRTDGAPNKNEIISFACAASKDEGEPAIEAKQVRLDGGKNDAWVFSTSPITADHYRIVDGKWVVELNVPQTPIEVAKAVLASITASEK